MKDFDYDVMQKKRTARGAMNKKGGSKSKKCTLPSDYMTPAQKKAMNGPTITVNRNQPMDWASYKAIESDSMKVEYIKYLQENYHANWTMIAEMMGVAEPYVCKEGKRLGIKSLNRIYNKTLIRERQAAWERFCHPEQPPVVELEPRDPLSQPAADSSPAGGEPSAEEMADALEEAKCIEEAEREKEPKGDLLTNAFKNKPDAPKKDELDVCPMEPRWTQMERGVSQTNTNRMDMTLYGWPDELTMTILRNMFREKNVKVRISAEVI